MIIVLNELADTHGQVSAICAVISFRDEVFVGIKYCLDKIFVCLMDICGMTFVVVL